MPSKSQTTRETEQQRLGAFFALGGFPRVPPHDEPMACREAWLRGYDEAKTTPDVPREIDGRSLYIEGYFSDRIWNGDSPMGMPTTEEHRFTASEVQLSNKQVWNAAISRCRQIINEVADDYQTIGAAVVARQIRCVSLLLEPERKPE